MERKEAKLLGLDKFNTGRPCANGHLSFRYTASGTCAECINGSPIKSNSKTLEHKASELRITALRIYNEAIKIATSNYERAVSKADEYESEAKRASVAEELDREIRRTKFAEFEANKERHEALKRMVKVKVFIHPDDRFEIKEGILDMTRKVCPSITMQDITYKGEVGGGVYHTLKCFPEHKDEILKITERVYNARNVIAVPRVKPQSQH